MGICDPKLAAVKSEALNITTKINSALWTLETALVEIFSRIWGNPDPTIMPQDLFDEFGTDAHSLFDLAATCVQTINSVKGTTMTPPQPPYNFTINADGTVTVGSPVLTPPPDPSPTPTPTPTP